MLMIRCVACAVALVGGAHISGCIDDERTEDQPIDTRDNVDELGIYDCTERQDTGYTNGNAFSITVVSVDGKPAEVLTANAYVVMQEAAANDGVDIRIVSGFRTMSEQEYLYGCYINCNCNSCNLAASPGHSNHQSGHALDLNTSEGGVLSWLNAHGGDYGFARTVPSEAWHWEWWGGGPGGGPCGASPECVADPNAGGCNGTVVTRCDDTNHIGSGDCGSFGAECSTGGGNPHCVHPYCTVNLDGGENGAFCTPNDDGSQATRIGTCAWGAYTEGDCAAYGGTCSEAGDAPHCVHFLCWTNLGGGEDGSFCHEGQLASCSLGTLTLSDCAAETPCGVTSATSAACVDPNAPPDDPPDDPKDPSDPSDPGDDDGQADTEGGGTHHFEPSVDEGDGGCASVDSSAVSVLLLLLGAHALPRRPRP